jgi:hypothetical protein
VVMVGGDGLEIGIGEEVDCSGKAVGDISSWELDV